MNTKLEQMIQKMKESKAKIIFSAKKQSIYDYYIDPAIEIIVEYILELEAKK